MSFHTGAQRQTEISIPLDVMKTYPRQRELGYPPWLKWERGWKEGQVGRWREALPSVSQLLHTKLPPAQAHLRLPGRCKSCQTQHWFQVMSALSPENSPRPTIATCSRLIGSYGHL